MALTVASPLSLPLALPEALAGVELGSFAAELNTLFRKHGARSQPAPLALTCRRGRLPTAAVATFVLESDTIARAVVSHVRAAPFYAGLAIVVHPRPELDAPLLVADVNVPPPGTLKAFVDCVGPGLGAPTFPRVRDELSLLLETAKGVRRSPPPPWIAPLSGGAGARLRALPLGGEAVLRTLAKYIDRYLDALDAAPKAKDPASNRAAARSVRDAVRANGPAGKYLSRTFDASFASQFLSLFWRDDAS